jgi:hypothetical protein
MPKQTSNVPKSWTRVTRTSKIIAFLLYFVLLGLGFVAGMSYQKQQDKQAVQPICGIYYQSPRSNGILPYRTLEPYCPLRSPVQ